MNQRTYTRIIITVLLIILVSCNNGQNTEAVKIPDIDSISKASTHFYYEDSAITGTELFDSMNTREGSVTIATVNPDGSPNLAVAVPGVIGEKYLTFGLAPNQTGENIKNQKLAVVSYYIYTPNAESKTDRNRGARLIVKYIENPATLNEIKTLMGNNYSESSIYLEIVKILPLG